MWFRAIGLSLSLSLPLTSIKSFKRSLGTDLILKYITWFGSAMVGSSSGDSGRGHWMHSLGSYWLVRTSQNRRMPFLGVEEALDVFKKF